MKVKINTGKMRDRLILQYPDSVPDGQGGGVYNWRDVATLWAQIETVNPTTYPDLERFQENQMRRVSHYLITIRFRDDISTEMRFMKGNRIFEIESVVAIDEISWKIQLYCREEGKV